AAFSFVIDGLVHESFSGRAFAYSHKMDASLVALNKASTSQPAQRDFLDAVAFALFQNQVGTWTRRHDILVQVNEIDPIPDGGRSLDRLAVGQPRVAVKI